MKSYISIIIALAVHVSIVQAQVSEVGVVTNKWGIKEVTFKPVTLKKASDNVHLISPNDLLFPAANEMPVLERQMDNIRSLCPLLQQTVSLELDATRKNNEQAQLNWQTKNAILGTQFIIERSFDDTMNFRTVNYVWPNSDFSQKEKYDLQDENGYQRLTYYRVRLEQSTGKTIYSNIAEVKGFSIQKFQAYPNPASNLINLSGFNDGSLISSIKITDATGRIIWQNSGSSKMTFYQQSVNISNFSKGLYIVNFEMADQSQKTISFIKQ